MKKSADGFMASIDGRDVSPQARYNARIRQERRDAGVCIDCAGPIVDIVRRGKATRCNGCREKIRRRKTRKITS